MTPRAARTILVIDGDVARRDRIVGALGDAGYRVLALGDDEDAVARIDAEPPALILLAWAAPLVSGVQLFDALAGEPRRAGIPVVVLAEDATASRVPAHAAAVLGLSPRMRMLLGVIARLSGATTGEDRALRRDLRRSEARTVRVVSRTLVDVDSNGAAAEADTARVPDHDQEIAGPT